jgi:Zn-dependent metalloprotease
MVSNWIHSYSNRYIDAPDYIHGYYYFGREIKSEDDVTNVSWEFIEDNKALLKINQTDLGLSDVDSDWNSYTTVYYQNFNGIPIVRGRVVVSIRKDGYLRTISNRFYPDITISTTPQVTEDEAIEIAKHYFPPRNPGIDVSLVILPSDYIEWGSQEKSDALTLYLAWKVKFHLKTIYVDAETGNVLFVDSNIMASNDEGIPEPKEEPPATDAPIVIDTEDDTSEKTIPVVDDAGHQSLIGKIVSYLKALLGI